MEGTRMAERSNSIGRRGQTTRYRPSPGRSGLGWPVPPCLVLSHSAAASWRETGVFWSSDRVVCCWFGGSRLVISAARAEAMYARSSFSSRSSSFISLRRSCLDRFSRRIFLISSITHSTTSSGARVRSAPYFAGQRT